MHDAHAMGVVEASARSRTIRAAVVGVHPLAVAIPPERPAADELVGHPAPALIEPRVVDGGDVGWSSRATARASRKNRSITRSLGFGLLEHLDRDVAIEPGIERQEDLAEPAVAQPLAELEASQ